MSKLNTAYAVFSDYLSKEDRTSTSSVMVECFDSQQEGGAREAHKAAKYYVECNQGESKAEGCILEIVKGTLEETDEGPLFKKE